jgi:DNA-binding IclR family transcriptional regulator
MSIEGRGVQSIEVGARLLVALVDNGEPMMLRDVARHAGIAAAQAHAYLVSYRNSGLVEQDEQSGLYRLGRFAVDLAIARMRSFDPLKAAKDFAADLAAETGLTVAIAVWGTFGPTIVHVSEGTDQVHTNTRAGTVYAVSGTATGRLFAAYMPEALIREAIQAERAERSRSRRVGQVTSFGDLKPSLRTIRALGYSTMANPPIPGVNAMAAPVFDHVGQIVMAITLIGPAETFDCSPDSRPVGALLGATRKLSSQLGFDSDDRS